MISARIQPWKIEKNRGIFKVSTVASHHPTEKGLLRFVTAGSVDDGKSTLIGRLMMDSKSILEDQMRAIERASRDRGLDYVNLALLTDGLKAEREQGITIDVAYRYFTTARRKFIIGDAPGHVQYTRNLVTAASTANLMILLVDAKHGMIEQTRRHLFIASLLRIPHLVVCINKMDLVDYSEERFEEIRAQFNEFSSKIEIHDVQFIPISALQGDNIVERSNHMAWYQGAPLLHQLENVHIASDFNQIDLRAPIQNVIYARGPKGDDYRGYAVSLASGTLRKGEEVLLLPTGLTTRIKSIDTYDGALSEVSVPGVATVLFENEFDLSRGDMIVRANNQPSIGQDLDLNICWLAHEPLDPNAMYSLIHLHNEARCMIKSIHYKFNVNTLHREMDNLRIGPNDIAKITVRTTKPLFYDDFRRNRTSGSLILIDEKTNNTCAAGMII
jgi:sulfate adenylyltransferase subunit 1